MGAAVPIDLDAVHEGVGSHERAQLAARIDAIDPFPGEERRQTFRLPFTDVRQRGLGPPSYAGSSDAF